MVREALDEAAEQAIRAGQIVRRLRDFMSNGEMERRVESLQRLINEANALALVGSREHGIDVQLSWIRAPTSCSSTEFKSSKCSSISSAMPSTR